MKRSEQTSSACAENSAVEWTLPRFAICLRGNKKKAKASNAFHSCKAYTGKNLQLF
jgi:hypothetical protein